MQAYVLAAYDINIAFKEKVAMKMKEKEEKKQPKFEIVHIRYQTK